MNETIRSRSQVASSRLIGELVRLGYLRPSKRYKSGAIKKAVASLRSDLVQLGAVAEGDLSAILYGPRPSDAT